MCRVSTRLSLFLSLVRSDVTHNEFTVRCLCNLQVPGLHLIVSVGEAVALEKVVVENTTTLPPKNKGYFYFFTPVRAFRSSK